MQAVLARERVVLGPGRNRVAVGPVVDDRDPRRIGPFFVDQPAPHPVAERDDRVGIAQQVAVDPIERAVDERVVEILEQRGDFGKNVLAQEHEPRAGAPSGKTRRETENRRIGQRHDDVGSTDVECGEPGRGEVGEVVRGAAGEPRRGEASAIRPENV